MPLPLRLNQDCHARINGEGKTKREEHRQTVAPHLLQDDLVANLQLHVLPLEITNLRMMRHMVFEEHCILQHNVADDRYHYRDVAYDEIHQSRVCGGRADGQSGDLSEGGEYAPQGLPAYNGGDVERGEFSHNSEDASSKYCTAN